MALLESHRTTSIIDALFSSRFQIFGRPKRILSDHAPVFSGHDWGDMLDTFDIQRTMTSAHSSHENGMVERSISLLKIGFGKIRHSMPKIGIVRAILWSCVAKNLIPMVSSGLSPAQIMIGRNTILETLTEKPFEKATNESKERLAMHAQLQTMLEARSVMIKAEADKILRIGLTRPLGSYSKVEYRVNDYVLLRMTTPKTKEEKWVGGYRVVGVLTHHLILERGIHLFKYPKYKVRPTYDEEKVQDKETTDAPSRKNKIEMYSERNRDGKHDPSSSSKDVFMADEIEYFADNTYNNPWEVDALEEFKSGEWLKCVPVKGRVLVQESILNTKPAVEHSLIEQKEERVLTGTDLSRITPRLFLQCARARTAVVKEIHALLRIHNGKAALQLVSHDDKMYRKNRRIYSMIVIKKKPRTSSMPDWWCVEIRSPKPKLLSAVHQRRAVVVFRW